MIFVRYIYNKTQLTSLVKKSSTPKKRSSATFQKTKMSIKARVLKPEPTKLNAKNLAFWTLSPMKMSETQLNW